MTTGNRVVDIETIEDLAAKWPFLSDGLVELNASCGNGRSAVTPEAFFKMLLNILAKNPGFGRIAMLVNQNGKPLAFGVMFDNTEPFCKRSALVYAVYSNGKCPTAVQELRLEAETWARREGFKEIHAVSRRINGATFRIFEKMWGFRRTAVVFKKELL